MDDIVSQLRQASFSSEDYRWKAADIIESLRQKTQYWPDNAERDAVIRHQKEEIERLRDWNEEIALNARKLIADNERLVAALRDIITDSYSVYAIQVASAALNPAED